MDGCKCCVKKEQKKFKPLLGNVFLERSHSRGDVLICIECPESISPNKFIAIGCIGSVGIDAKSEKNVLFSTYVTDAAKRKFLEETYNILLGEKGIEIL